VTVSYTMGEAPLPAKPSGFGRSWGSKTELRATIDRLKAGQLISIDPVLMAFLATLETDPDTVGGAKNITTRFDFDRGTSTRV